MGDQIVPLDDLATLQKFVKDFVGQYECHLAIDCRLPETITGSSVGVSISGVPSANIGVNASVNPSTPEYLKGRRRRKRRADLDSIAGNVSDGCCPDLHFRGRGRVRLE